MSPVDAAPAPPNVLHAPELLRRVALETHRIQPVGVSPLGERAVLVDLGNLWVGIFTLKATGNGRASLGATYGEHRAEALQTVPPTTHWYTGQRDAWKPGGTTRLVSAARRACRFVQLTWETGCEPDLDSILLEANLHPSRPVGTFSTPDPVLNRLWEMSSRTTHLCMQDYYEDGVKRDGLLWIGDCRVQYLCNIASVGDHSLMRRSLLMIAASQREDGALPAAAAKGGGHRHEAAGYHGPDRIDCMPGIPRFPSTWILLNYCADFLSSVFEYTRHSGDLGILPVLADTVRRLVDYLDTVDPSTLRPFHDYFTDNGITDNGTMLSRPDALLSQLVWALRDTASMANLAGDADLARRAQAQLERRAAEWAACSSRWDCWHQAFLAYLAGLVDAERLERAVLDPTLKTPATAYMWYWACEALFRAGKTALALDVFRRAWGRLPELGLDTCPETLWEDVSRYFKPGSALSYCHGWSAAANALFPAHLAGIQPLEHGWKAVRISPNPAGLPWIRTRIPTPLGPLFLHVDTAARSLSVIQPPGMRIAIDRTWTRI
jgi:hypothetical protein